VRLLRPAWAHIRSNAVAYIALFFALNAGAYAFAIAPKNSVTSSSIRDSAVKNRDLADGAVTSQKVGPDSLGGGNINESLLGPVPDAAQLGGVSAAAYLRGSHQIPGGDLSGTYAAPQLKDGAVGIGKVAPVPAASLSGPIYNVGAGPADCFDTNGSFPNNSYTHIEFSSVDFDNWGLANQPNPGNANCFRGFVIPQTGLYLLTASVGWVPNSSGDRKIQLMGLRAGGGCCVFDAETEGPASVGTDTHQSTSGIARLEAGDHVFLQGFQSSGGAIGFVNGGLQIAWIGR
jgi:hypothetical protein